MQQPPAQSLLRPPTAVLARRPHTADTRAKVTCAMLTAAIDGGRLPALRLRFLGDSPTHGNPASAAANQAVRNALVANAARAV